MLKSEILKNCENEKKIWKIVKMKKEKNEK